MKKISKEKALKHLKNTRKHLQYLRESYVENERDTHEMLDIKMMSFSGKSIREERREDILKDIKEVKIRIAKFERIVK